MSYKNIIRTCYGKATVFLFIVVLFILPSCSNTSKENKNLALAEVEVGGIIKKDSTTVPVTIIITNPVVFIADTCPPPFILELKAPSAGQTIPKSNEKPALLRPVTKPGGFFSQIQTYTTDNGLAMDAISCSCTDKLGNLWFGTSGGGVSRYDGKSFTNYSTAQGLAGNEIFCITEDKTGNLWFGTNGTGASRFDGKSFTNFTTSQGLANNKVWSILEDKIGNLWFGTYQGGVSRYDGNRVDAIESGDIIAQRTQQDIKKVNGKLVKSFTNYTTDQGLAYNSVRCIAEDKVGNIWFGTYGRGVSRYDGNRVDAIERGDKIAQQNQQDIKRINGKLVKSFTNYNSSPGLTNSSVLSIIADKTGTLWFGTNGGGVICYDPSAKIRTGSESFTNYTTAEGLANNRVVSIMEDKSGNLWFGTNGGGVSRYDPSAKFHIGSESFTNFTTLQGLANNVIKSITEDKTGNLWFGTDGAGVCRYDGSSFMNYTINQGLPDNVVLTTMEDKTGNIWFGTQGKGICCYNGNIVEAIENGDNNAQLTQKEIKKTNEKLVRSFTNYSLAQINSNNTVFCTMEDKMGDLWFGTLGGGVCRYDGNRVEAIERVDESAKRIRQDLKKTEGELVKSITNYTAAQGLANSTIRSVLEDKIGNIWFGTDKGVSRYDGNRVDAIENGDKTAQLIQQDLKKINGRLVKTFTNYTISQGLAGNRIWKITEDKTGNIWFGTDGEGVSRYDGNRIDAIEAALQRGEAIPLKAYQNLKKTNGKLVKSFTNFTIAQGLANNTVLSITEDKSGNLWFGTNGGGVSRYDGKSFTNFTTVHGLPDNSVTQVVIMKEDPSTPLGAGIAIGTNFGVGVVTSFAPLSSWRGAGGEVIPAQNSLNNEELKNYTPVIEIYNSANGYPVKDVNSGQNAMFADSKGIIWIGTGADKTALVRFDYAALNKNKMPPDVVIQSVKINNENICWFNFSKVSNFGKVDSAAMLLAQFDAFGKTVPQAILDSQRTKFSGIEFDGITKFYSLPENLILPYAHNNVTFDFAAIEPAKPYLVRYQYILEGYGNDWSSITNKTSAVFGNINEGKYTFRLKAQSPFGVWSEPIEYKFTVLPPWYRHWLVYLSYVLMLVFCIILIVRWNGRRLRAKANELREEVRKATVTIVEKNKIVEEQKKVVEEKSEKLGEALKDIKDSINYAERIQRSFLATTEILDHHLKDYFVFFRPKDVVSGDFYWAAELNNGNFALSVADSTGHGVPGAIMSILNISSLEKSIEKETEPDQILNAARKIIIERLKKDGSPEGGKDGMDCSLLVLNQERTQLLFAAANNPVFMVRNNEITEYKPDKMPVGKHDKDTESFTLHTTKLQKGDLIYALTDGFPDQFGGEKGKKYMIKNLKELLLQIAHLPMADQKQKLSDGLIAWKGESEQVDDILIVGIRV